MPTPLPQRYELRVYADTPAIVVRAGIGPTLSESESPVLPLYERTVYPNAGERFRTTSATNLRASNYTTSGMK